MSSISVDFTHALGKIKPMHAVNNVQTVPYDFYGGLDLLAKANIPYARLHDTGYYSSITPLVDTADIFPNFDADENDPSSYDFAFTDVLLSEMNEKGIIVLENAVEECDDVVIASISGYATIADEDVPDDIDILVTHDPPYGILDENIGSVNVLNIIMKAKPRYHLFGHIHSTAGQSQMFGGTECVNIAATVFL